MEKSPPGAQAVLLADDPMARIDVPHLMAGLGGRVIEISDEGNWTRFTVETGPARSVSTPSGSPR